MPISNRFNDDLAQERAQRQEGFRRRRRKFKKGLSEIEEGGLSEEQRAGLFGRVRGASEAGARARLSDLSAQFGGDTSSPLFRFQAAVGGASASAASQASLAGIEIDEARRLTETRLATSGLRLGFEQLGLGRDQFESGIDPRLTGAQAFAGAFGRARGQREGGPRPGRSPFEVQFGLSAGSNAPFLGQLPRILDPSKRSLRSQILT